MSLFRPVWPLRHDQSCSDPPLFFSFTQLAHLDAVNVQKASLELARVSPRHLQRAPLRHAIAKPVSAPAQLALALPVGQQPLVRTAPNAILVQMVSSWTTRATAKPAELDATSALPVLAYAQNVQLVLSLIPSTLKSAVFPSNVPMVNSPPRLVAPSAMPLVPRAMAPQLQIA